MISEMPHQAGEAEDSAGVVGMIFYPFGPSWLMKWPQTSSYLILMN